MTFVFVTNLSLQVETKGNVSLLDRIRRDRLIKLAKQTVPVPRPSRTRMLDLPDFVDDFYAQHLAVTEKCAVVVLQGEVFVSNAPYLDSGNQEWPLLSIQVCEQTRPRPLVLCLFACVCACLR